MIRDIPRSLPIPDVSLEQDSDQAPWTVLEFDPEKVWTYDVDHNLTLFSLLPAYAVYTSERAAWKEVVRDTRDGSRITKEPYEMLLQEVFDIAKRDGLKEVRLYDESLQIVRTWTL